jgi:hypothetical protein
MTKLNKGQISTVSGAIYSHYYTYFLDKVYQILSDPSSTGFDQFVNEALIGDGEDTLPENFNWKDLVVKKFVVEIEVGYDE